MDTEWLKANINVKDGDNVRILDEGAIEQNKEGKDQLVMTVGVVRNSAIIAQKKFQLNKTNHKVVAGAFGFDSKNWIGKEFQVNVVKKQDPSGRLVDSVALSMPGLDAEGNVEFG
jgi:hypothetical protein